MALSLSTAARNAAVGAIAQLVDGGSGPGLLRVYTGSKPASPDAAATGTLLAEMTLSDPAFAAAAAGSVALDVTPAVQDTSANNAGTAGWFRLCDSTGAGVVDGTVTGGGGGGDVTLSTATIVAAGVVTITSGAITMPGS